MLIDEVEPVLPATTGGVSKRYMLSSWALSHAFLVTMRRVM